MNKPFQILTILGSPHGGRSNTRALVEDFVHEMAEAGLKVQHEVISLGNKQVLPCKGCWNCTRNKPCPLSREDDLEEIKAEMIACDMLILASPVYCNHISAQMKAFFDRLFTWCHIFPLLGKYSLSATTTGSDGIEQTSDYLEKMLATYGTFSFGTIASRGGLTAGFFPGRTMARERNRKLAKRAARFVVEGKRPRVNAHQRRMFKVMKRKMMGIHTINYLRSGALDGQPKPPWLVLKLVENFIRKSNLTDAQLAAWGRLLQFELGWWKSRGWLEASGFKQLLERPAPIGFDVRSELLAHATR